MCGVLNPTHPDMLRQSASSGACGMFPTAVLRAERSAAVELTAARSGVAHPGDGHGAHAQFARASPIAASRMSASFPVIRRTAACSKT